MLAQAQRLAGGVHLILVSIIVISDSFCEYTVVGPGRLT
jgi:hypothetical protein